MPEVFIKETQHVHRGLGFPYCDLRTLLRFVAFLPLLTRKKLHGLHSIA